MKGEDMDKETLAEAGRLLLGAEWQQPMARLLGPRHPAGPRESLDPRLVRRWAIGERPIPAWVGPVLAKMLERRRREFEDLAKQCANVAGRLQATVADHRSA
jgi:hypothetical protein